MLQSSNNTFIGWPENVPFSTILGPLWTIWASLVMIYITYDARVYRMARQDLIFQYSFKLIYYKKCVQGSLDKLMFSYYLNIHIYIYFSSC